jgi:hypothetical protein
MGQPKAQGQRSIQIDGLRVPSRAYRSKLQATSTDFCSSGLETSKLKGRLRYHRLST